MGHFAQACNNSLSRGQNPRRGNARLGKGLHSFRHTVATQSIVNGADVSTVSAILGHSTVSTTLNIYTHAVRKAKAKAANLMAGLIESDNNKSA